MGKSQREKGKRGEREVCIVLNTVFGYLGFDDLQAERNLEESRRGSFDIRLLSAGEVLPFAFEVKNHSGARAGQACLSAIREALLGAPRDYIQVGVAKVPTSKGTREWVALIPLPLLALLIAQSHGYRIETEVEPYAESPHDSLPGLLPNRTKA